MDITLGCNCGVEISEATRDAENPSFNLECSECGAVYAITITHLRRGAAEKE